MQARLAEAEAILSAARACVIDAAGKFWDAIEEGRSDITYDLAQVRFAIVHAMHEAVRSVDLVFHAAGTNAIYSRNPLERIFVTSTSPFSTTAPFLHNTSQPAKY